MSYGTLIGALLQEGEARCQAILRRAQEEAGRMLDSAAASAAMVDREADAQVQQDIAQQRLAVLSRAALLARQILMQAKHEVLDAVWRRARERALALDGPERTAVLRALLLELLAVAPPGPLKAVLEERERSLLGPSLHERGIPYEVRRDDDLLLGVEVEADGAVLRSSLAGRMLKAKPELLAELNRLLFREQQACGERREARGSSDPKPIASSP